MSMRLKKVCPQCSAVLHARKLACQCAVSAHFLDQRNRNYILEAQPVNQILLQTTSAGGIK